MATPANAVAGVAAKPIVAGFTAADAPTWRAAYSDRTAAMMARFCELAYESFDLPTQEKPDASTRAAATPAARSGLEAKLAAVGFSLAALFDHESTQAYLAVSDQFAVLAFRGTQQLNDWLIDIDARPHEMVLPGGRGRVRVHEGFLDAFAYCSGAIEKALAEHVPATLGLYITGHSLGGALAQIASAWLERDNLAACYTFGSPRVGELAFDTVVKCPHYRVIDHFDIVPTVPPPFYDGYLHSGDPRLVRRGALAALRRDRSAPVKVATNLIGFVGLLATRKAVVIEDHMIGRYREALEGIAVGRQGPGEAAEKRAAPLPKEAWIAAALGVGLLAGAWLRGPARR